MKQESPENLAPAAPQLEFRAVSSLAPYSRNARTHSPEQIAQLERAIEHWGWTNAVLADEAGIVAGHGRVVAAENIYKRGGAIKFPNGAPVPKGCVPVVSCDGWNESQRRAYILADNQLALNAGYDMDLLKLELSELKVEGFDLDLIGFPDLTGLLDPAILAPDKDPDDAPPVPENPHSKPGDIWCMGPHRVMCGDSTRIDDWNALMDGAPADVCWIDPPYNVAYEGKTKDALKIKNDAMGDEKFKELLDGIFGCLFAVMKDGASIYVAYADRETKAFHNAFVGSGFHLSSVNPWIKDVLVLGRGDYQSIHENIIYGWKPGNRHRWYGGRKQTTVDQWGDHGPVSQLPDGRWQIKVGDSVLIVEGQATIQEFVPSIVREPKPKRSADHPTMKPVGLIVKQLKNSARTGDIVADGCGGSGSTMMAAEVLGMSARLMELDPKYTDVIVKRWQNYTGRRAVHAVTGEEFPE